MNPIRLDNVIESSGQAYSPLVFVSIPFVAVSSYVDELFPEFVREDHPRFIEFVKSYYEWMESKNQTIGSSKFLRQNQDIDTAIDPYLDRLLNEFLINFPKKLYQRTSDNTSISRANLLKNVREFYRAKGTEKSFEILFRILYGANPEFYYPRTDILKVSDGKWIEEKTIRIVDLKSESQSIGNPSNLVSRRVRGLTSNTTAYVERVTGIQEGDYFGYELYLNRSSITGKFISGERLYVDSPNITEYAGISACLDSVTILDPGEGYSVGQTFKINSESFPQNNIIGNGGEIRISSVDSLGRILKFEITKYGIAYGPNVSSETLILNKAGVSRFASIKINLSANIKYDGYYLNEDGQASTTKFIQDGYFYQQFSYVVYFSDILGEYEQYVKKLVHPAGFKIFGAFRTQPLLNGRAEISSNQSEAKFFRRIWSSAKTQNEALTEQTTVIESESILKVGPSLKTLYQNRFKFKPVYEYDANLEITGSPNYFGSSLSSSFALTPISKFEELGITPKKLDELHNESTRLMPDPCVFNIILRNSVSLTSMSNTFTLANLSGISVGMRVIDTNNYIQENTKVESINGNTIQLTKNVLSGGTTDISFNYY